MCMMEKTMFEEKWHRQFEINVFGVKTKSSSIRTDIILVTVKKWSEVRKDHSITLVSCKY